MPTATSDLAAFLAAHRPLDDGATWKAGDVLDGWRVTAFLGRGGSGEVYRVEQVGTGRAAALKALRPKPEASEEERATAQARFLREADFLVRNESPSFPKAFAVGEAEGRPYVVMELLDAKPLPRRDGAVAAFLLAVCRTVRTLHRRGLVHRDIKPANILWRANGDLVLSDLGLLKGTAAGHTGATATLVDGRVAGAGTPHYAAPEQFDGGSISAATDIHALGVLIDDCFGGKPPRDWARIVRRATSSLPGRRYRDVEELMRAIRWRHAGRVFLLGGALLMAGLVAWWGSRPQLPRDPQALRRVLAAADEADEASRWQTLCENIVTNGRPVARLRLGGATQAFRRPIVLSSDRDWWIVGPGTLDAALTGADTGRCTRVCLDDCVLLNRTRRGPSEAALRYVFRPGAYLNFIDQDEEDDLWRRGEVFRLSEGFDGAFNALEFGGPATVRDLRRKRQEAEMKRMESLRGAF